MIATNFKKSDEKDLTISSKFTNFRN